MAVRTFDGVDDRITLDLGSLGFAFGPGTMAVIARVSSNSAATRTLIKVGSSAVTRYDLEIASTNAIQLRTNSNTRASPAIRVAVADGWVLIAATKATGTSTPRFSCYKFATNTWTHEDASSTVASSGAPSNAAYLGAAGSTAGTWFPGDIGIAAVWDVALSDAEIEDLILNEAAWTASAPVAMWVLDQTATTDPVLDEIDAADQTAITGTSVATDYYPFTGSGSVIGAPVNLGYGDNTATGTTATITTSASSPAGASIIVLAGSGNATATLASVTDSAGNTYTVDETLANGANGAGVGIAACHNALALGSGGTITTTWSASMTQAREASAISVTGLAGTVDKSVSAAANNIATWNTGASGTLAEAEELAVAVAHGTSRAGDSTPGGGFTEIRDATNVDGAASISQYRITTTTGAVTGSGTGGSVATDWASALVTYPASTGTTFFSSLGATAAITPEISKRSTSVVAVPVTVAPTFLRAISAARAASSSGSPSVVKSVSPASLVASMSGASSVRRHMATAQAVNVSASPSFVRAVATRLSAVTSGAVGLVAQFNGAAQQYFQDLVATAASSLTLRFSMTKTLGAEGDASPVMTNDVRTTMLAQSTADVSLRKLVMARVFASASGAAYVVPAAIGVFLDIYARLRLVTRRATRLMLSGRVAIDTESLEVSTLREQVGGVEISPLAHALTIESPTLLVVHVDEEALEIRRYTDNDTLRVAD